MDATIHPETAEDQGADSTPPVKVRAIAQLDAVRAFVTATFDLIDRETQEWATGVLKSQLSIEQYLRLQQDTDVKPGKDG